MSRKLIVGALAATMLAALSPSISPAQSKAAKIANALAAAPASIAAHATVKDLPDKAGNSATLREGSNGWTCFPSMPKSKYITNNATCVDQTWLAFGEAMMAQKAPSVKQVGYSYMLSANDWESNTDPNATAPTPDNQWHHVGPHVMLVYPDPKMLEGLPVRPSTMGPYVMYAGTPYAHVMLPVK